MLTGGVFAAFFIGITYEYLAAWAYFHELMHAKFSPSSSESSANVPPFGCTGVLTVHPDGTVIQGRNMDNYP